MQDEHEYDAVEAQLADPAVLADPPGSEVASKRYKELTPLVTAYRRYRGSPGDLDAARELLADATGEERELARAQVHAAEDELQELEERAEGPAHPG